MLRMLVKRKCLFDFVYSLRRIIQTDYSEQIINKHVSLHSDQQLTNDKILSKNQTKIAL